MCNSEKKGKYFQYRGNRMGGFRKGGVMAQAPRVTFEPLLAHFNSFCASVELGARPLLKCGGSGMPQVTILCHRNYAAGRDVVCQEEVTPPAQNQYTQEKKSLGIFFA